MIAPAGLMPVGRVPKEPGGENVVKCSSGARRKPGAPVIAPAGLMAAGSVSKEPGEFNVVKGRCGYAGSRETRRLRRRRFP